MELDCVMVRGRRRFRGRAYLVKAIQCVVTAFCPGAEEL